MDLYTRCQHCLTTFRVTTQQLQVSNGQVRCGSCRRVFDAFATLTAQEPRSAENAPEAAPAPVTPVTSPLPPAHMDVAPATGKPASPQPDPAASLYEWEFRMPKPPRRTGLWASLSALLALLLAAQAAYAFRMELMVMVPQTRQAYARVCDRLGCVLPLPRQSSFLHIDASDLKAADPARPNEIELTIAVRNRAPVEVDHPAFELTLTNAQDQTIARRVFLPAEYLANTAESALKPGSELPVHLFLDTGQLRAAGYRLYLFYP